jgi:hypothetical protein
MCLPTGTPTLGAPAPATKGNNCPAVVVLAVKVRIDHHLLAGMCPTPRVAAKTVAWAP